MPDNTDADNGPKMIGTAPIGRRLRMKRWAEGSKPVSERPQAGPTGI
jgi:hypothetical protein